MSEAWVEGFKAALLRHVQQFRFEVVEVTGWDENSYDTRGCPSCSYTDYEVSIYYRDVNGKSGTYTYNGKFTHLLEELTS